MEGKRLIQKLKLQNFLSYGNQGEEIGLHPDILSTIADMLIEASQRTQLIVTTHSDALISTLPPESVLICERDDEGRNDHRLEAEGNHKGLPLLENYTIGDLWRMGHIGGKPW